MKTLFFEGAGWEKAEHNRVGNCRIRTRIKNNNNRIIYLEMAGHKENNGEFKGYVSHCFYDDRKEDSFKNYSKELSEYESYKFNYDSNTILHFVNTILNCSFDNMKVINDNSVRVHDTKEPLC